MNFNSSLNRKSKYYENLFYLFLIILAVYLITVFYLISNNYIKYLTGFDKEINFTVITFTTFCIFFPRFIYSLMLKSGSKKEEDKIKLYDVNVGLRLIFLFSANLVNITLFAFTRNNYILAVIGIVTILFIVYKPVKLNE